MAEVALAAEIRQARGSAPSKRLRKEGKIPGVLYGHGTDPTPLAVDARALRVALNTEAGVNAIIQLNLDGKKQLAFTRDVQRHPVRGTVSHVDFLAVNMNEEITVEVPITFEGEAEKVTKMGGIVEHLLTTIEVTATVANLPSHIILDVTPLELEGTLRVSDIKFPKGVSTIADPGEPLAVGRTPRVADADLEAAAASGEAGEKADGDAKAEESKED